MDQAIGVVLGVDRLAALLVLGRVDLGVLDHLVDVGLGQTTGCLDPDLLFLAGRLVLGRDVDDAVGVDVEGHLDLRHATRSRRNAHQVELAQHLVVGRHFTLALEDADGHGALIVFGGREHLALLGRDRGVAVDDAGEHAAQRLDAQRQRGHVEQQHVLDVALQHAGLDRRTDRDNLVRVDALVRLLAEELLHDFLDLRHAGHAADQHHFADLTGGEAGILQRLAARLDGLLDKVGHQRLELGAGQLHRQMLRTGLVSRDERQVDLGLRGRRQLDLGLFGGFLQALQRELVVAQVDALLLLELVGEVADQAHVEVFTTEEGVAVGRLHLEHAVTDLEDRDVEGAAAEVVHGDRAGLRLVKTIGERCSGRLVDDAQHFEAGDLAGVLGGLTLCVVEISRNGDDGLLDLLAEISLRGLLHLLQDEGRDLRGRIGLAIGFDPRVAVRCLDDLVGNELLVLLDHRVVIAAADEALHRKERTLGIGHRLALRRLADKAFAIVGEGNDRRRRPHAFCVLNHLGVFAIHYGDARIRGAEVDPNDLTHGFHILFATAGWLGPDGAPYRPPDVHILAILRR